MELIKTIIAVFCILLVGCQTTNSTAKQNIESEFIYQPQGHKEFIFARLPKAQQKLGYSNICFTPPHHRIDCSLTKLQYQKYVGKRGYYTSAPPIPYIYLVYEQRKGDLAHEAILETGERIYVLMTQNEILLGQYIVPYPSGSDILARDR